MYQLKSFVLTKLLICLVTFSSFSQQDEISKLTNKKKTIGSVDGLSQVTIKALIRDNKGFVWIGTQDGLNRYDGKRIKQYRFNPNKKNSLVGNHINTLFRDSQDRIWIGTVNNGLCYYDGETDAFIRPNVDKSMDQLYSTIIKGIAEDSNGRLWVVTNKNGLFCLHSKPNSSFNCKNLYPSNLDVQFTSLTIDANDIVWLGTSNGGLYNIDLKKETKQLEIISSFESYAKITCFLEEESNIWIGTEDGFYRYEKQKKRFSLFDLNTGGEIKTRNYDIYDIKKDTNNIIWIGAGNGLYCFQSTDYYTKPQFYSEGSNLNLSHNTVYSIMAEGDHLWIGTAKDLDIFDFSNEDFKILNDKSLNGLSNSVVFSIYKNNTNLWVGTAGGLNLITEDTTFHFTREESNPKAIADNVVRSIQQDTNNHIWFGTTNGVSVINLETFDPYNPQFINHHFDSQDEYSISGNNIRDIHMDQKGSIWIATYGQGINQFTGSISLNEFKFNRINQSGHALSSDYAICISEDQFGNLWVGTQNGINQLTHHHNDFNSTAIYHDPKNKASISDNFIHEIYFDQDKTMWVATKYGLNRSFDHGKTFHSFHLDDGLPNEVIYSIQEDKLGNLWLGTNNGLVHHDTNNDKFIVYKTQDGIADNEFDLQAHHMDKNGVIYMGGINGINIFNPIDLIKTKAPINTIISDILISNTNSDKISVQDEIQMDHLHINEENRIKINYDNFPLIIQLASPFSRPLSSIKYYYKLLPNDNEWNDLGDRSELQVLNLSNGRNDILICGGNSNEIWENNATELSIYVKPPWWKSYLAYFTYFAFLCASIYLFLYLILRRKEAIRESIRLKELEENKSRFYANITHEFRTPLTVILGMLDNILSFSATQKYDKIEHSVKLIRRNGLQLLNLVNQLLDLTKLRKGQYKLSIIQADVIVYIKYLIKNLHSFGQVNQVQLIDYIEEENLIMDFDPKALEQILTNLIGNAIKFSNKESNVIIHVYREISSSSLVIKVKDYGTGMAENELNNIFNRFYQIDNGLNQHDGSSGLGLSMVKELIELLNGEIEVKSKISKGSEFILKIPITQQAEMKELKLTFKEKLSTPELNEEIESLNEDSEIILIVEDNKDIANYISICLNDRFTIKYCENGLIGLEAAIEIMPDIIISDVMMPKMDGYELCTKLKSNELTNHIPIILLTARVDEKDRLYGLNCGADAYLNKPFNPEELYIRIEQLIKLRKDMKSKFSQFDILYEHKKNTKSGPNEDFINRAIRLVFENLDDNDFRSIHLAKAMNVSETQLYRKIKAITDQSTAIFIRSIRLKQAKHLLQTTLLTIAEVAYDTGFSDPAYFSRVFKNTYGVSPNKLRSNS